MNNGVLRKNEYEDVLEAYKGLGLNVIGVDASDMFINRLEGVSDPETKRKIIGNTFIEVFDKEAGKIKDAKWLGQGTIYPDVIESVSVNGPSKRTKSLLIKLPTNYPKQFMEFIISYRTNHTLIQKNYFSN